MIVLIIFPVILQTVINLIMLSIAVLRRTGQLCPNQYHGLLSLVEKY